MKKWFPRTIAYIRQRAGVIIPLAVVLPFVYWAVASFWTAQDKPGTFATQEFGRLPVLTNGRVQPIDSLARNSLLQLREKQTANLEPWKGIFEHPKIISATAWAMGMMMNPHEADQWPVFRIDHPELKGLLGLAGDADKAKHQDGKHYAWSQLSPKLEELQEEWQRVRGVEAKSRTPFDNSVTKLWNAVAVYMRLQNTLQPQNAKDWAAEQAAYHDLIPAGVEAVRNKQAGKPFNKEAFQKIMEDVQRFDTMSEVEPPALIPPPAAARASMEWKRTGVALLEAARHASSGAEVAPPYALGAYARMASAYKNDQPAFFNAAVGDYRSSLLPAFEVDLKKTAHEQFFNAYMPFLKSMYIYIFAGVCVLVYWFEPRRFDPLRRGAFWLVVLAFVIHLSGLAFRMYQEGRPPVTNLYSSAIFIGVIACLLGILVELFWKNAIGLMKASIIGFSTLIIAHHLALAGDTMEMMRAVLDSNFWLATHVVAVTFGYAATFAAGICAMLYIYLGVFTTVLDAATNKAFAKIAYAIICFAVLFSFIGTVLGGIWADQSWGRFWGWDPKENGALIIVLWNAIVLHARWGGLVRERGLMNLLVVGNIVTAWSWFGVNMLGIGLHSYGFTSGEGMALLTFVLSQVVIIGLGLIPKSAWRSFRTPTAGLPPALPA